MSDSITVDEMLNFDHWYHRMPLGGGLYTPGRIPTDPHYWDLLRLPDRVDGKSLLDIGAANGLISFEAEKRGANRVLATDVWRSSTDRRGFEMLRSYLGSKVEDRIMDAYEISEDTVGTFDIVVCAGLLYHLRDPYEVVKRAVSVARECVVIESSIAWRVGPGAAFAVDKARASDPAGLRVIPNLESMKIMLEQAGCTGVEVFSYRQAPHPDSGIPPVRPGLVKRQTPLFSDYRRLNEIGSLISGARVQLLMDHEGSTKVGNQNDGGLAGDKKPVLQGWVDSSNVKPRQLGLRNLARRVLRRPGGRGAAIGFVPQ